MRGQNRKLSQETLNSLARTAVPKYANGVAEIQKESPRAKGLRERNGNWHFRLKVNGKEVSGDTGLPAREDTVNAAIVIRDKRLQELKNPAKRETVITVIGVPAAVDKFVDWYRAEHKDKPNTWKWAKSNLTAFSYYFKDDALSDLNPGLMDDFKQFQNNRLGKASSVRHSLKAAKLLFKYGRKQGWLSGDPLEEVDFPTGPAVDCMRILSPEEEEQYQAAARQRSIDLADMQVVMTQQGCRPEEVMTLEQFSVDLDRREFRIKRIDLGERGITGKSVTSIRKLAMLPDVYRIFLRRKDGQSRWMFPSQKKPGTPIKTLQKAHEWVVAETGIQCRIYDHRHTFATRLAVRGCPLPVLAMLMGHSDMTVLHKYVHPGDEDMKRALMTYGAAADQQRVLGIESDEWPKVDREGGRRPLTGRKPSKFAVIRGKTGEVA